MNKRTTMVSVLAAGALLLAGCGSSSGNATAGSTTAAATSAAESTTATTAEPTTVDESTGSATEGPTTTIGGDTATLDEQSTAWFQAACEGLAPLKDLANVGTEIGAEAQKDPSAAIQKLAEILQTFGGALTGTSAKLKDLPPPTFDGGDELAANIVKTFGEAGPKLSAKGEQLATSTDPTAAITQLQTLGTDISSALAPLANAKLSPQIQAAIQKVPGCSDLPG